MPYENFQISSLVAGTSTRPMTIAAAEARAGIHARKRRQGHVSEDTGRSQRGDSRGFRLATGEAPHRYLIHLRMAKARDLLEQSDMSITEVALSCGFNQSARFASMFHRPLANGEACAGFER
jgi:transcriptional regulator GlxA family with amidase domain